MRAEKRNLANLGLDEMPVESVLRLTNEEGRKVPEAVAGTGGRIAALDAADLAA